jgi:hypothetical protein
MDSLVGHTAQIEFNHYIEWIVKYGEISLHTIKVIKEIFKFIEPIFSTDT